MIDNKIPYCDKGAIEMMVIKAKQRMAAKIAILAMIVALAGPVQGCDGFARAAVSPDGTSPSPSFPLPTILQTPVETLASTPALISTSTPDPASLANDIQKKKICNFLNKQGDYSDDVLQQKMIAAVRRNMQGNTRLGLMADVGEYAQIEGVVLFAILKDESTVVIAGFEDKDGQRFVTGLEIPSCILNEYPETGFSFDRLTEHEMLCTQGAEDSSGDKAVVEHYLEMFSAGCNPVVFQIQTVEWPQKWLKQYSGDMKAFIQKQRDKVPLARKLAGGVWHNGFKPTQYKSVAKSVKLPLITNTDDARGIEVAAIPLVFGIKFYH
jgi:hypothetical protein